LPVRVELVSPGELGAVEPAARRQLPFGLGRELFARPPGVGQDVGPGDVDDRMVGDVSNTDENGTSNSWRLPG